MSFVLPPLPFAPGALAAHGMCQETLELHHGKHHNAYVTALNGLVEKNDALKGKSLEELIRTSYGREDLQPVFNNAGQHWNHSVFWESLSPTGGGIPGVLAGKPDSELQIQAVTGIMETTGLSDGPPVPIALPVVEFMTGVYAAGSTIAALRVKA